MAGLEGMGRAAGGCAGTDATDAGAGAGGGVAGFAAGGAATGLETGLTGLAVTIAAARADGAGGCFVVALGAGIEAGTAAGLVLAGLPVGFADVLELFLAMLVSIIYKPHVETNP
jgi:hypothetical protein